MPLPLAREQPEHLAGAPRRCHQQRRLRPRRLLAALRLRQLLRREHLGAQDRLHLAGRRCCSRSATRASTRGKLSLERLVEVACENPAKIFGLSPQKGSLEVGADADLVLVDLDRTVKVANDMVLTRSGWTVLDGHEMHGWGVATFLRGKQMSRWEEGAPRPEFIGDADGRYLRRVPGRGRVPVGDGVGVA
ncbi:MAG: amidohydrolase family protein [Solirubrobacterales bacterium]